MWKVGNNRESARVKSLNARERVGGGEIRVGENFFFVIIISSFENACFCCLCGKF